LRLLGTIFAAAVLVAAAIAPAYADKDENTIYAVSKSFVDIEVRIQKSLAAFPKLYEILVAEGKKFGEDSKNETEEDWRNDKSVFGNPYGFYRTYRLRAVTAQYVSLIVNESEYTGGAHPNHGSKTRLWDRERNTYAEFRALFKNTAGDSADMQTLSKLILASLAAEKKRRDVPFDPFDMWSKDWKADFESFGQPSLAPSTEAGKASGVTFHFSPYEVGPYAEGDYVAFVPASALMPLLTPEAQKLFGGERTKEDAEEN
jgi:hypothetical protein